MTPTEALIACAELSKQGDKERVVYHVAIAHENGYVTIAASDGKNALRYDFSDVSEISETSWLRDVPGGVFTAPGAAFPRFGEADWLVIAQEGCLQLVKYTKGGHLSKARTPPPVELNCGSSVILSGWSVLTGVSDPVVVDLRHDLGNRLRALLEVLDGDADITIRSCGFMHLECGPIDVDLGACPEFHARTLKCWSAWDALTTHPVTTMRISRNDFRAPVVFESAVHQAVTMPVK